MAPERTWYLNIAYGFSKPGVTADTWDDAGWRRTVDTAAAAGYTRIAFYLWSSQGFANAASTIEVERNRTVRERIRRMIPYAHEKGLTVAHWFTPANLPPDLWGERSDLQSPAPYPPGYATICPSRSGAIDLAAEVHREEMAWFTDVDVVQLWFYDPGGCWCDVCKTRPAAAAVDQVRRFAPIVKELNPDAELQISVWPVWANEPEFGVTYRQEMIDELAAWRAEWPDPVRAMDTPAHPENLLPVLGERGFSRAAFYLNTNLETGWFLPQPGLRLLDQIRADHRAQQFDEIVTMRIEVETRWVQDAILAAALDSPDTAIADVVRQVAHQWAGDAAEGEALTRGLLAWDDLLQRGAKTSDETVSRYLASVTGDHSPIPDRLHLLKSCGLVVDALASAARGSGGAVRAAKSAMEADPALRPLWPTLDGAWDGFVRWVGAGIDTEQF